MNAIFLDIDGVLNTIESLYNHNSNHEVEIDIDKLLLLKELIDETNSLVVLSSSWRIGITITDGKITSKSDFHDDFLSLLDMYGITLYDRTQSIEGNRTKEIHAYLKMHPEIDNYIILDDEYVDDPNLIQTSYYTDGLTREHVNLAISKLSSRLR